MANLTRYKGFYFDTRDGVKVGVDFTYSLIDGKMVNVIEVKITPQI